MIAAAVIIGLVGALLSVIGYLIWKKEMITLLHDYHYDKVTEENKKSFCTLSGIGILVIGAGLILTALLLGLTSSSISYVTMAAGFAVGLAIVICAGVKYNR